MKKILYIEDDVEIGSIVKEDLEQRGYLVDWMTSGEKADGITWGCRLGHFRCDASRT